ncbi:hypothetical protein FRACYDRAFT_249554 [Fragilariopsis cylindrus CCMP1102]|uniref:Uncharacterized protein n=1 Tax=Fragilariopsis cylindrus CCMP1102 TaxID=635003 RepID=A0A1E7ES84_9STRA|nr:hypothetical protein FRACYDRAFT_249554 [Fragilariopsis cylindrus CCMP1102]|eukprot:OEU08654.1 hypothetical protein FRACYDRAFT_249554 [Fragilariopsis cylindrus CCMP1102]
MSMHTRTPKTSSVLVSEQNFNPDKARKNLKLYNTPLLEFRVLDAESNPTNISNNFKQQKANNMMMIHIFSSKYIIVAALAMTMTMTINNNNNNSGVFVCGASIKDTLSNAKDTAANAFNSTNEALMNATDNLVDALNTIGDEDVDDSSSSSASSMFFLTSMSLSMMSMSMIGIVLV